MIAGGVVLLIIYLFTAKFVGMTIVGMDKGKSLIPAVEPGDPQEVDRVRGPIAVPDGALRGLAGADVALRLG